MITESTLNFKGLTEEEAGRRLEKYGLNQIEEKKKGLWIKIFQRAFSVISLMLLAAAGLSLAVHHTFDFYFILAILVLNIGITLWHENKADKAIEILRKKLVVQIKTLRGGRWQTINSLFLVPGDIIELTVGDLVPADLTIEDAVNVSINEAVLTGESLPKEKKTGETAYSGSVVFSGMLHGEVTATGNQTYFGKIVGLAGTGPKRSALEKDIISISEFLIVASLASATLLTGALLLGGKKLIDILLLDLSLLIAGVPISLPTVMTLIISFGALILAQKNVLTRRLASLEDLANVNLLLADKTGTLTRAEIVVEKVIAYAPFKEKDVIGFAAAASQNEKSLIDQAIVSRAGAMGESGQAKVVSFVPADSIRKRSTALAEIGGKRYLVASGAPPIIESLSVVTAEQKRFYWKDVEEIAEAGDRAIAIAVKENPANKKEEGMKLAGLLTLSDALRKEAPAVIDFLETQGIAVKMMTGDIKAAAKKVSAELKLTGKVISLRTDKQKTDDPETIAGTAAFAEMLPDDKLKIVEAAKKKWTVAVTGDGVNDLPAIKAADVGIAVYNAVNALKGGADIVLLSRGIEVIREALIEARKIFSRLYTYSLYRLSESFRLVITVLILGLLYADYPLTPIQLILLAFLNDIPIISLSFNRVKNVMRPAEMNPRDRFVLGSLFGLTGIINSLLMFFILLKWLHLPWPLIQTAYFLKLTVGGHMLIYVAHTKERWYKFLPSPSVIWATTITQSIVTVLVLFGIFVAALPWTLVVFVWIWAFFWMQISELVKIIPWTIYKQPIKR